MSVTAVILATAFQLIATLLLVLWARARVRRALDAGDQIARVRGELGAMMMELEATADRNVTILEDRLGAMRELLEEADRRIGLLARESSRRDAESSALAGARKPAAARPAAASPVPGAAAPGASPVPDGSPAAEPSPRGNTPPDEGSRGAGGISPAPDRPVAEPGAAGNSQPRAESIPFIRFAEKPVVIEPPFAEKAMELYRRGFSSDVIAARLGSTLSEVELALAVENGRERGREGDRPGA